VTTQTISVDAMGPVRMTFSSIGAEFLPGLHACIDALNQPHDDIRNPEGSVGPVKTGSWNDL
jgi:hypothetical protein